MPLDDTETKRLKETVKWFSLSEELFPGGGLVLAAVSGGPDSMALLSVLLGLGQEIGFRLAVGHFDHRLRETGDVERNMVEKYARGLSVPFYFGSEDVRSLAASAGESLEESARKARYGFLGRLADEIGADRIATGHTRDDHVETVLMRVIRGTGIRGLAGIPSRRGKIVRPLLCLASSDTLAYCDALEVPYTIDPSNDDTRFFRNRVRVELLPLLRASYNEGVDDNLARLSKNAQDLIDAIRQQTSPLIRQSLRKHSEDEWAINCTKIMALDQTSLVVLFGDVLSDELGLDMDFSRTHYEQLTKLVRDTRGSGKTLHLPGVTVKKEYENLLLTRSRGSASVEAAWHAHATLTFPGETKAAGVVVKTEILDRSTLPEGNLGAPEEAVYCPLGGIKLPLVLRSPGAGDRMQPFGMTGSKKLSDIFSDRKILGRARARSLVVTDANDILWLVGITASERCRVDPSTEKIVRITVSQDA